jgi:hypothetical protein
VSVVIFGSGKWAKLIGGKLNDLSVNCLYVGNSGPSIIPRHKIQDSLEYSDKAVIIASATKDHYSDFLLALKINPRSIYVEKGFSDPKELELARSVRTPIKTFFLSQYRFSKIFDVIKQFEVGLIKKSLFTWGINSQDVAEWMPHIVSIDNYIRNARNHSNINNFGKFKLDSVADVNIYFSEVRKLIAKFETDTHHIQVSFGVNNLVKIINLKTNEQHNFEFKNEDCLHAQLENIFVKNNVSLLECL